MSKKKLIAGKGCWQYAKEQAKKKGKGEAYAAAIAHKIMGKALVHNQFGWVAVNVQVPEPLQGEEIDYMAKSTKQGAGSRGGKIIGYTRSNKAVYDHTHANYRAKYGEGNHKTSPLFDRSNSDSNMPSFSAQKAIQKRYKDFSSADHLDAANLHGKKAKEEDSLFNKNADNLHRYMANPKQWHKKSNEETAQQIKSEMRTTRKSWVHTPFGLEEV